MLACPASAWTGEKRRCRWCNDPLGPRRQRWCSDECAKEYGANHWFTDAAYQVRIRDNHACTRCPSKRIPLHVHHVQPALGKHRKTSCIHHQDNLTTLCTDCHKAEHAKKDAA
jgi:5-methylcytosine-specific restriction endonuclease McrA